MKAISLQVSESEAGERIDKFLSEKMPEYSRNYFLGILKEGKVLVNNKLMKPSYRLLSGDTIDAQLDVRRPDADPTAEDIPLDIIYEDTDIIVLNKQAGIVVHPGTENSSGTLVNALIHYYPMITEVVYDSGSPVSRARPGLVHRLDKDTSGVMVVAKNKKAMAYLSEQIHHRQIGKTYLALCWGTPKNSSGTIRSFLGRDPNHRMKMKGVDKDKGKEAISSYEVIKTLSNKQGQVFSLIRIKLETGRTHQIRVQMSEMGCPVLGDSLYGNKASLLAATDLGIKRQLLHAEKLEIKLPNSSKLATFEAAVPNDFATATSKLSPL